MRTERPAWTLLTGKSRKRREHVLAKRKTRGKNWKAGTNIDFFFFFNHRLTDCYLKRSKAESDV